MSIVICLGLTGVMVNPTYSFAATIPSIAQHHVDNNKLRIKEDYRLNNGDKITFIYDKITQNTNIYKNNVLTATLTKKYFLSLKKALMQDRVDRRTCQATLGAVGTANAALWGAAGALAEAPPASAVAAVAGAIASGILGIGALFCPKK